MLPWCELWLCFGIKSAVQDFQLISTSLILGISKRFPSFFILDGSPLIRVYIDDIIMAHESATLVHTQLNLVRLSLNRFNIPHDGQTTIPTQLFVYLGIQYDLKRQACRLPTEKVHKTLALLSRFSFGRPSASITKKELESLQGKLIYFSRVHLFIRPLIAPFIELNKRIPAVPKFASKQKSFSFALFPDLIRRLRLTSRVIFPLVRDNA